MSILRRWRSLLGRMFFLYNKHGVSLYICTHVCLNVPCVSARVYLPSRRPIQVCLFSSALRLLGLYAFGNYPRRQIWIPRWHKHTQLRWLASQSAWSSRKPIRSTSSSVIYIALSWGGTEGEGYNSENLDELVVGVTGVERCAVRVICLSVILGEDARELGAQLTERLLSRKLQLTQSVSKWTWILASRARLQDVNS